MSDCAGVVVALSVIVKNTAARSTVRVRRVSFIDTVSDRDAREVVVRMTVCVASQAYERDARALVPFCG